MFFGFLLTLLTVLLPPTATRRAFHLRGHAQGTTYTITYYATDSSVTQADVARQLTEVDQSLSLYQPNSLINKFNESRRGVVADQHLKFVVDKALQVYQDTNGVFDATVAPLVQAWGFGPTAPPETAPTPAHLHTLLASVGSDKLHWHGDSLVKDVPTVHLDLNGIAQGYTVDMLAALLERRRIRDYLVELGGEIRVRGFKWPGGERQRIGIERPDTSAFAAPAIQHVIYVPTGGITTSGNYHKFRQVGPMRVAHLINPKSGYPFHNELISVTVVAFDAITADAYDNALMGMGLKQALAFLRQRPALQAYFIYQRPNGTTAEATTAGFQRLLSPL